ncbi:MAG: alpha/beta hydrolase [Chitinophagales bacterium]|nr:lysophospholipase [Chitinophagales bacterium]MCZ2393178.1 alpha/beta hydrolase [Chitinophagales bacterium]
MIKYIKWLKIILGIFVGLNLIIFIGLIFQEPIIFRAKPEKDSYKFKILIPHKEYLWIDSLRKDHQIFNVIYTPRNEVKKYIFLLHGSQGNVEYHTQFIPFFTENNYEVWMMDYPGFGKSKGNNSEDAIYQDASKMFDIYAKKINVNPKEIIIVGKDLGTGIASRLAFDKKSDKLILISPFTNIQSLLKGWMPWFPFHLFLNYNFPNDIYLKDFKGSVGIFYGANDLMIPHRNVRNLQPYLQPGDEFHEYDTKRLDNVIDTKEFQNDLKLFLKK